MAIDADSFNDHLYCRFANYQVDHLELSIEAYMTRSEDGIISTVFGEEAHFGCNYGWSTCLLVDPEAMISEYGNPLQLDGSESEVVDHHVRNAIMLAHMQTTFKNQNMVEEFFKNNPTGKLHQTIVFEAQVDNIESTEDFVFLRNFRLKE